MTQTHAPDTRPRRAKDRLRAARVATGRGGLPPARQGPASRLLTNPRPAVLPLACARAGRKTSDDPGVASVGLPAHESTDTDSRGGSSRRAAIGRARRDSQVTRLGVGREHEACHGTIPESVRQPAQAQDVRRRDEGSHLVLDLDDAAVRRLQHETDLPPGER